jgi:hypothetical protein
MAVKIEHRLGVQAPPEAIWSVVSDLEGWRDWNPLYPKAEGAIRIGATLTLELALPETAPRTIRPVVLDWVPNEQILWKQTMFGGLVNTTRYMEIEQLAEAACIFSNGEIFGGPGGALVARRLRRSTRAGFAAMGEAVKALAEARWREGRGGPT